MGEVWIVETGEFGEGGEVLGVYADRSLAIDAALMQKPNFEPWAPDGVDRWKSGCDWIKVTRHKVQFEIWALPVSPEVKP